MEFDAILKELRSGHYARDLTWLGVPTKAEDFQRASVMGQAETTALILELLHSKRGQQVRVEKALSDDLLLSDIGDLEFDDIPFLAPSMEVFFEDPSLPTVLVGKCDGWDIERMLPGLYLNGDHDPRIMVRMDQTETIAQAAISSFEVNAGMLGREEAARIAQIAQQAGVKTMPLRCVLNLKEPLWKTFFSDEQNITMEAAVGLSELENCVLREMLRLAAKVCAYAALPRYKPAKLAGPITRAMGGKPGFRGRPTRPTVKIVYLPAAHTSREEASGGAGTKRDFRGRRGFFRIFRHERYVNMRGKRIFVAPIKNPHESEVEPRPVMVVRKAG